MSPEKQNPYGFRDTHHIALRWAEISILKFGIPFWFPSKYPKKMRLNRLLKRKNRWGGNLSYPYLEPVSNAEKETGRTNFRRPCIVYLYRAQKRFPSVTQTIPYIIRSRKPFACPEKVIIYIGNVS